MGGFPIRNMKVGQEGKGSFDGWMNCNAVDAGVSVAGVCCVERRTWVEIRLEGRLSGGVVISSLSLSQQYRCAVGPDLNPSCDNITVTITVIVMAGNLRAVSGDLGGAEAAVRSDRIVRGYQEWQSWMRWISWGTAPVVVHLGSLPQLGAAT
jgi:hypothetical protein